MQPQPPPTTADELRAIAAAAEQLRCRTADSLNALDADKRNRADITYKASTATYHLHQAARALLELTLTIEPPQNQTPCTSDPAPER